MRLIDEMVNFWIFLKGSQMKSIPILQCFLFDATIVSKIRACLLVKPYFGFLVNFKVIKLS